MRSLLRRTLPLALLLASAPPLLAQEGPVVVYLVRHAERADDGMMSTAQPMRDPPLSEAGLQRARELATLLADAGITHVHSTDYLRTRSTVQPIGDATGISVQLYDADEPGTFARQLRATPGVHLVVGHSNTVPGLVEALGGDAGPPIEDLEYDRIYVVYVLPGGATGSAVFRFGSRYRPR